MTNVVFTFHETASEENQDRMRHHLLALPGVRTVGRISPDATKPALRRMWYAEVADDTAATHLVTTLRQHDDIQSADLPAARSL